MDKCVTNGCIFSSLTGIQFSPGEDGRECGALNQPANRDLSKRLTIYEFSTLYISVRSCRILVFAAFTCIVAAPIKCLNNKLLTYTVNSPSVCTDVQFTPFTQNFFCILKLKFKVRERYAPRVCRHHGCYDHLLRGGEPPHAASCYAVD